MLICLICIIVCIIVKILMDNRHFNINSITISQRWVYKGFEKCAKKIVYDNYNKKGKAIFTKKGKYRVAFLNDVNKKCSEIIQECCSGNHFNDNFCNFIQSNYPNIRVKDLQLAINEFRVQKAMYINQKFDDFLLNVDTVSPNDFFEIKNKQKGDVVGVYVIHNETQNMYYVGQAKRLFFRINQHFTGHGNGDVYADYKYGDNFTIKIVKLSDSGYDDLNLLEKDLIRKYNALSNGYNKTAGNN